jgi:hypothetical protein
MFVAQGSWNAPKFGYDVVTGRPTPTAKGFAHHAVRRLRFSGRPSAADRRIADADGSLLVSGDSSGIYRAPSPRAMSAAWRAARWRRSGGRAAAGAAT